MRLALGVVLDAGGTAPAQRIAQQEVQPAQVGQLESFDLVRLVRLTVEELRSLAQARNLSLKANIDVTKVAVPVDLNGNNRLDVGEPVNVFITVAALGDVGAEDVEILDRLQQFTRWDYGLELDQTKPVEFFPDAFTTSWEYDEQIAWLKGFVEYIPANTEVVMSYTGIVTDLNETGEAGELGGIATARAENQLETIESDDPSTPEPT